MRERLFEALFLIIKVGTPTLLLFVLLLFFLRYIKGGEWLRKHSFFIIEFLFVVYLLLLASILGFFGEGWGVNAVPQFNLVPLVNESPVLMILNAAAFFPLGVFLPTLFSKFRSYPWLAIIVGLVLSLCVELLQTFFMGRLGDIDDVIFNSLGCASGCATWVALKKLAPQTHKTIGFGTISFPLALFALFWAAPFGRIPYCGACIFMGSLGFVRQSSSVVQPSVLFLVDVVFCLLAIVLGLRGRNHLLAVIGMVFAAIALFAALVGLVI